MGMEMEIQDLLLIFTSDVDFTESLFQEIFLRRPKLAISSLKQLNSSLKGCSVLHNFTDNSHNLVFRIRINLLLKFIQCLNGFTGDLSDAKELTELLIRFDCNFELNAKYQDFSKLFVHNIAIKLLSIDPSVHWQWKYIWFLAKKSLFSELMFRELPDYWTGQAVHRLKRLDRTVDVPPENCRKFVRILLISGNFPDFDRRLTADSLEELDSISLKLLLVFGFDFNQCLNKSDLSDVCVKYPNLGHFLTDAGYGRRPLPLKQQVRIYYRRQHPRDLNLWAKRLYEKHLIPQQLCQYLRFKEFIEF